MMLSHASKEAQTQGTLLSLRDRNTSCAAYPLASSRAVRSTSSEVKVFRAKFFKKIELYSGAFQKTLIIYRGFFNNYECRCQYNEKYELVDIIFLKNGNYHRLDGPAYICINNSNNNMFCINGEKYKDELSYLVKVEQFNRKNINFWEKLI